MSASKSDINEVLEQGRPKDNAERYRKALEIAVGMLMAREPGDSRAVSPIAVALASVAADCCNDEAWAIIHEMEGTLERNEYLPDIDMEIEVHFIEEGRKP